MVIEFLVLSISILFIATIELIDIFTNKLINSRIISFNYVITMLSLLFICFGVYDEREIYVNVGIIMIVINAFITNLFIKEIIKDDKL